jgi:beta-glucosidase
MRTFYLFIFIGFTSILSAQIYQDSSKETELRVRDLLSRMTWEEKCWQLFMVPGDTNLLHGQLTHGIFGLQVSAQSSGDVGGQGLAYQTTHPAKVQMERLNQLQKYCVEETRLGIPMLPFDEALHGLVRNGATAFPQAIALAATWDVDLMEKAATHIAMETKARGIRQILSPVVNLASDVRWGRTEETYGEDPYLSAKMGYAFMYAFESHGVITTPKHFVANVGDGGRDSYPMHQSPWYLERTQLIPFETAIKKAGAGSIMTAYNSLNGSACSSNEWLLTEKLKKEWGFKGFVISDANAVGGELVLHRTANDYAESGVHAINAGLDVIFQTDIAHFNLFFPQTPVAGMDTNRINDAVSRVLRAKFNLGLFEHPYATTNANMDSLLISGHDIALKVAEESMVLLKNEGSILPLSPDIPSIAVFGPDATECRLGGYSGPGFQNTSILDGLQTAFPNTVIQYEAAAGRKDTSVQIIPSTYITQNGNIGFVGAYFDNPNVEGTPVFERRDEQIDFHWTLYAPNDRLNPHFYSVRWIGTFTSENSETISIGLEGNDGFRMYIGEELVIDQWDKVSYHQRLIDYRFEKNKPYPIRIEFKETQGNGRIKFIWKKSNEIAEKAEKKRIESLSRKSKVNIVVVGIEEGEFNDRASLRLSVGQESLIRTVAASGNPTVVVLVGGSAITMNEWINDATAILDVWYPGEAGGTALANILSGKVNPSGKLPITFPVNEAQLPLVYNHLPTGRGDDYTNLSGEPLFPFGYGLSYSNFAYSGENSKNAFTNVQLGDTLKLPVNLMNTSDFSGDEIVQCYLKSNYSRDIHPVQELIAFKRVHVNAKSQESLSFDFALNTELSAFGLSPGSYEVQIGSSSKDIRMVYRFELK